MLMMSLFRAKSFSSTQAWMSRFCMCNQRKENEHLPQPAEQQCLCSFPFIASLCPQKQDEHMLSRSAPSFCHSLSKAKDSQPQTFTLEFMQSTLSHRNTFVFSEEFNISSASTWCLLRELLESQTLPVSCSFASAHHLPLSQHPTLAIQE